MAKNDVRLLSDKNLLRISKAEKKLVETWQEGAYLASRASIPQATLIVAVHRWRLARSFLKQGIMIEDAQGFAVRSAISRYYYSMYHALRAAAYVFHGGDDYEEHRALPSKLPSDFPNVAHWVNALKNAREMRNQADYDPYPRTNAPLTPNAAALRGEAKVLVPLTRTYLTGKGCPQ